MHITSAPLARRAHTVEVPAAQRDHRRAVTRWALAHRQPLHRDALALVIDCHAAAHLGGSATLTGPPIVFRWTRRDVVHVLSEANVWCDRVGASPPDGLAETLETYLRFLTASGLLTGGSDQPRALRAEVQQHESRRPPHADRAHPSRSTVVFPLRDS
ncbi:MAG: hypothetical protein ACKOYM_03920 [Actinomycetes bacterium]